MGIKREIFISTDCETSGDIPGRHSLLVIGACLVDDDSRTFEAKLKPITRNFVPAAMEATGLSLDEMERVGLAPEEAMAQFRDWILEAAGPGARPVFVGLNAPYDWCFVNWYFHTYLGENPFGHTALDIKALFMGATGCTWDGTRSSQMDKVLNLTLKPTHDALDDARYQAELFRLIRRMPRCP